MQLLKRVPKKKVKRKCRRKISVSKPTLSVRLRANDSALHLRFCFWLGPTTLFMTQRKIQKRPYPYIFWSHGTIHTFKNDFTTVFLVINFQFLANKRYPNMPLVFFYLYKFRLVFGGCSKKDLFLDKRGLFNLFFYL